MSHRASIFLWLCLAIGVCVPALILTGLDRTLLQWHFAINWPAWINRVEMIANGWLYHTVLSIGVAFCLLANSTLRRAALIAVPMQFVMVHSLKFAFGRVRPVNGGESLLFDPWSRIQDAYPSGHATVLFTLSILIVHVFPRLRWVCIPIAAIYIWLRIHTAAHFPSDILAGALLGTGVATSALLLSRPRAERTDSAHSRPWMPVMLAWVTIVIGAAITLPWSSSPPEVEAQAADARVAKLYTELLDRPPDKPGLAQYSRRLQSGVPMDALVREMIGSDEYRRNLREIQTPEQRVEDVYQRLLNRPPTFADIQRDAPLLLRTSRSDGRLELLVFRLTFSDEFQSLHP